MELPQDLYETPADRLDNFGRHSLQPQGDWKEEVQDAWQRIERFLREERFRDELILDQEVRVLKVVKGGSSGKGTTLNYSSDVDMVLFLSCFSSFQNQAQLRKDVITLIQEKLDHCCKSLAYHISLVWPREGARAPRSLSLQVQSKKSSEAIRVDVLPAFDALGPFCPDAKPSPEIYEDLITSAGQPGEFSSSFTELQRHFVKSCPTKLKSLLRLVKHWYLQFFKPKYRKVPLPSKYALELLTIYAWEMGTEKSVNFHMDEGFVAVMKLLRDILDQRARDVQVTVRKSGKEAWTLSVNPYSPIWKMKKEIKNICALYGHQRLSFQEPDGERQPLSSQKTLADYCIFSKVSIRVLEIFPPEIQVFVKESSGQNKPYAINPDDSIWDLKEKIEVAGGPYVKDQMILKFQGRNLRNRLSLRDLQIKDCDTITLIRRS